MMPRTRRFACHVKSFETLWLEDVSEYISHWETEAFRYDSSSMGFKFLHKIGSKGMDRKKEIHQYFCIFTFTIIKKNMEKIQHICCKQ